ncbi:MAG: insulinase family protein [Clostridia bacterium]|nr:insulinase family protein [Clostridia bacterium]
MQTIESSKVKEKIYIEKLENGLTVAVIPKKEICKKYVIWGTEFGSIDNNFKLTKTDQIVKVPDGIAHYLEHKLFEQENGKNSLDVLSSLGVDANAYTTNNHTAYLFEATDNFYEALDEFMDYVQSPYFTDENVEKERGIIGQEIMMYDDYPDWKLYMNAMKCMYKDNPINIDVAGTKETIAQIDKEKLYTIYNAFYRPDNQVLVLCGDFEVDNILEEVKKRLKPNHNKQEVQRIYPKEQEEIVEKYKEAKMDISKPLFLIAYKDKVETGEMVKKDLAIECICNMLIGKSSNLYQKLYKEGLISEEFGYNYEFSKTYAHILIQNTSNNPQKVAEEISKEIENYNQTGFNNEEFERIKKKIYGEYVKSYNDISSISNNFLSDYFKEINSFEFLEEILVLDKDYVEKVFKEVFVEDRKVISVVLPNE